MLYISTLKSKGHITDHATIEDLIKLLAKLENENENGNGNGNGNDDDDGGGTIN